ncbi:MAG: TAT-variant-translocated molybdopterin oxidoreductase [Bacteroidota bacterium]
MSNKKYWQNFGELNQTEAFEQSAKNEFKEELLPVEELDNGMLNAKTPRRDFLKYLGFSTAAATLAASCEVPVRKAVPYLQRPDNLIPGVANYYASTYVNEGDVIPVIVKQRDGRPIKIEGNSLSKITNGGTSAQAQASVLDLYDTTRLRYPMQNDGKAFKEVTTFEALDKMVADAMTTQAGKPVVLLSSTITSPSTLQAITEFLAKQPAGSRHVQYDAISYSGMILANEASYGKKALPSYHFDAAKVIVSLAADFLGTWLNPVEFTYQYTKGRKISSDKPEMSRHIQFESALSLTGSNADDRFVHKPSEKAAVALALLAKLTGTAGPAISNAALAKGIDTAAAALAANKGAALVVCGSNDVYLQTIVNAINDAIGANGKTINFTETANYRKGVDADIVKLVDEMNAGAIGSLLIYESNPVYTYFESKKFADALKKVPVTVSFNGTMDETTELCKYVIPSHHWLESWGDAEPKAGYYSFQQPVINPLFKTRAFQTSLLKWSGNASDYTAYFKAYWVAKLAGEDAYNKALQNGVIEPETATIAGGTYSGATLADATTKVSGAKAGKFELVIYQKVSIGSGKQANNPWLQELPDPISKVTWDNYAMISPALANTLFGFNVLDTKQQKKADDYEVNPEKPTVKITLNGKSMELPVLIIPGVEPNTVAVALGYGRQSINKDHTAINIGRSANGAGVNAYPFVWHDGTSFRYSAPVELAKTGNTYAVAQTQVHGSSESRPVIYETSLAKFIEDPKQVLAEPRHERAMLLPYGGTDFRRDATIYPDLMEENKKGIKWGMSIDLNTCTGCSACVVACTAENNVSVVGKTQVLRAHEMHWLRIDRYFTGDMNNPDVVFQPMLCQHCDNAPCENVCPVAATNHSSEGLNQMTYNRCIGTRYCANNCPFKVRRFNWLDYTGSDSFADNQTPLIGVDMDESVMQMNDDLTRMVLNPDVTVRARGVIEKCSFCVQRLQDSKLAAKKEGDASLIRNVKVACAQACPGGCIEFGNVNDPESEVAKLRKDDNRTFYVLEQLHVLPNVSYQVKIKNTDRHVTNEKEEEGHVAAHGEVKKEAPAHH